MRRREDLGRVEVLIKGTWVDCPDWGMLEPGDIFRQFDKDGKAFLNDKGTTRCRALSRPKLECASLPDDPPNAEQWQPIETAKDGALIDVWVVHTYSDGTKDEGRRITDVQYAKGAWCEFFASLGEWCPIEGGCDSYDTITHWMARPAPPRKRETSTRNSLTPIVNTEES